MYLKYKILVNGLKVKGTYNIDGFTLKSGCFEKNMFNGNYDYKNDGMYIDMNSYLLSCITDYEKLSYNYFESDEFEEIYVSNKITKNRVFEIIRKNSKIEEKVIDLEKKLRLILNIPLLFQFVIVEFYDKDKKYVNACRLSRAISYWNRLTYKISPEEFHNNSRFKMNFEYMKNTNNNNFNRALEFYNDSFESEKISNRYILIFSALEALFNLDSANVTEKISKYSAKLLAENDKEEYDCIYKDIRRLYQKRCKYIHGKNRNSIKEADEKLLRFYVRKIIISYWYVIIYTKKTSEQILEYLDSNEKLDLQVRLFITSVNANSFTEQQHRLVNVVEDELDMLIPDKTKEIIYSKCEK